MRKVAASERLTASSFNPLISAHAKLGSVERAEAIFSLMLEANVTPSLVSYNSLATAYARQGDVDRVELVLGQATKRGCSFLLEECA